jgi:hypothetical protein
VAWDETVFSQITAARLSESFKNLTKEYDEVVQIWKQSGRHESDLETLPISDFTKRYVILYLHEFVHGQPDILSNVCKDLEAGVFTESSNTSKKRKGGHTRSRKAAGTQDETMAKIATAQVERNSSLAILATSHKDRSSTMADLAASQKKTNASQNRAHASQDILNKTKAVTDAEDRITQLKHDKRSLIKDIGGKDALIKLRNGESQCSICDEIDELEKQITTSKERLVTANESYDEATRRPPASPSA